MSTHALYDVFISFKEIHQVVLGVADDLNDEQLNWRPEGYSTSIGFHLWHLARESDYLKAALLQYYPGIGTEFGDPVEIWQRESLAWKWAFPEGLQETVGTGLSDEVASRLPIPKKSELLKYLKDSYDALEGFIEAFDAKYTDFKDLDGDLQQQIEMVRRNLLVFLTHDCRHLGMMECLKGLQTGFGSATEKRPAAAEDAA